MKAGDFEYSSSASRLKSFPRQKLSYYKKTQDWKEQCVDSVIDLCNVYGTTRRSDSKIKRRNYNLFNNKIEKADFEYVLNPFNMSKEALNQMQFPASLQPYDIVSPIFTLLFGEEAKRPYDPIVYTVNSDSINQKLEEKKAGLLQMLQEFLVAGLTPEEQQNPDAPPPPGIDQLSKYSEMSYREFREHMAQDLLNYFMPKLDLPMKFSEGWRDVLIAGEEIYKVEDINGFPTVRRVNPLEIHFVLPPNSSYIDEAEKIYERNRMSISEIIDEFYEDLTPAQIDMLDERKGSGLGQYSFSVVEPSVDNYFSNIPVINSIFDLPDSSSEYGIDVHRVTWASMRKYGIRHYIDPTTQMEIEEVVDEFYKAPKGSTVEWVEWFWIKEYWEGTRIGQDMYLNIRPRKQQFRSLDNLSKCKSGYVGTVYNATNSQSVSLMDRLYPWLALYLISMYRTELLMAANLGNIALIDLSLVPDGWEIEKWLYYANSMKIGFVNSYNEGAKGERTGRFNASTQNKVLPAETGNSIQFYVTMLQYLEQKMKDTAGITDQRLGAISPSELVGNTERAVVQSSHVTEPWFQLHTHTKNRVCTALLEVARDCMEENHEVFQYITDDLSSVVFTVDGKKLAEADYGVFVTHGGKEQEVINTLKALMQSALQADKIELSHVVDMLHSNSISGLKSRLKESEKERIQRLQQEQERQLEMQQQQMAAQEAIEAQKREIELLKLELERYKIDVDSQTKIQTAQINVFSRQQELDTDNNGIPDPVELASLALKEREMQSKEMVEKLKIEQTKVQNASQERIAEKQAKLKEKELEAKERIEKYKVRNKPKPKK